ncbi:hypothetical protein EP331_15755 [bacterium]|nr:MAG: hypothetical protein EP331_15755 [bacterium]
MGEASIYQQIGVWAAVIMIGLSIVLIALFGVKNLASGKHEWPKIAILVVPFVVFGIAYGVTQDAATAAMLTTLIMLGFMALLIAFSAVKSVFNF